ncbi:hypothetical protein [Nocardia sp. XZ_19_369]|uniref:hypothetical protein n=1 Tax=Nocardia sp. XZ_19_369 TaxID=2769487 RepID=UPI001E65C7EF|nr:hypothetical protein [Nocardia sp. XZ_19_369]
MTCYFRGHGCRGSAYGYRSAGDVRQLVGGQFDGDRDMRAVVAQLNCELCDFEEPLEQLLWCRGEIERQVGQHIEQGDICGAGAAWVQIVGDVEPCDSGHGDRLLGLQIVVGVAERLGERIVRFAMLCLAQHGVLSSR